MPSPTLAPTTALTADAVVIGAGPAGMFAVFQLGLQGIHAHLIDALPDVGGQCAQLYPHKPIYDVPGIAACTGRELAQRLAAQMAPFAPTLHLGQQVQQLQRIDGDQWQLTTSTGTTLTTPAVVLAAGVGAFVPRTVKLEGVEALVGQHAHYHPADLEQLPLAGQHVLVHGGDELAVEAAIAALQYAPASVTLMHRRDVFTGPDALLDTLAALRDAGSIRVLAAQPTAVHTDATGQLQQLDVTLPDGSTEQLPTQQWLIYQGISPKLGPIADWGLALEKKQLPVDTARFATCEPGLYAVGDINTYPGKRKLLLCAFHEATLAAFAIAEQRSGGPVLLQYTTTSTHLHALLGKQ